MDTPLGITDEELQRIAQNTSHAQYFIHTLLSLIAQHNPNTEQIDIIKKDVARLLCVEPTEPRADSGIPAKEAQYLLDCYGYEQIIILAIRQHKEKENWFDGWRTTCNSDKSKCGYLDCVAELLHYQLRAYYSNATVTADHYIQLLKTYTQSEATEHDA